MMSDVRATEYTPYQQGISKATALGMSQISPLHNPLRWFHGAAKQLRQLNVVRKSAAIWTILAPDAVQIKFYSALNFV
jgi:hypothetical protein